MKKRRKSKHSSYLEQMYREQIAWRVLKAVGLICFIMIGWVLLHAGQATGSSGSRSSVVSRASSSSMDFLQNR